MLVCSPDVFPKKGHWAVQRLAIVDVIISSVCVERGDESLQATLSYNLLNLLSLVMAPRAELSFSSCVLYGYRMD